MSDRRRGGSTKGSRPNNGGAREPGPGKKLGPPRQRFRLATPEEAKAFEQLASDLGFADGQALLIRLVERYDEQPGIVRTLLYEMFYSADERRVYAACVDESCRSGTHPIRKILSYSTPPGARRGQTPGKE